MGSLNRTIPVHTLESHCNKNKFDESPNLCNDETIEPDECRVLPPSMNSKTNSSFPPGCPGKNVLFLNSLVRNQN